VLVVDQLSEGPELLWLLEMFVLWRKKLLYDSKMLDMYHSNETSSQQYILPRINLLLMLLVKQLWV